MSKAKKSSPPAKCPSCDAKLNNQAKFCHQCGAGTDGKSRPAGLGWKPIALVSALIAAAFAVVAVVTEQKPAATPQTAATAAPAPTGAPAVDLSKMSPRQAADRLFNRVMAADERGNTTEAKKFAPMALEAYRLVKQPDSDAHYHVGLINLVLGDIEQVRKQVETLNKAAPDHLLGLYLEINVARKAADKAAEESAAARFNAAYDKEIATNKPEYQAHRATIDKLREQVVKK